MTTQQLVHALDNLQSKIKGNKEAEDAIAYIIELVYDTDEEEDS